MARDGPPLYARGVAVRFRDVPARMPGLGGDEVDDRYYEYRSNFACARSGEYQCCRFVLRTNNFLGSSSCRGSRPYDIRARAGGTTSARLGGPSGVVRWIGGAPVGAA